MLTQTYRLAEIKSAHTPEKVVYDADYPLTKYVVRPLSFRLSWIFLRLGITPNQITIASMVVGLCGCIFLATGDYGLMLWGSILINVFPVLDCCDGNVARTLSRGPSRRGKFLDQMADPIVYLFFFPCVGLGVFFYTDDQFAFYVNSLLQAHHVSRLASIFYPFLGALASSFHILRKYMDTEYAQSEEAPNQIPGPIATHDYTNHNSRPRSHAVAKLYVIESNLFESGGFLYPLILLAVVFKLLSLYLVIYAFLHIIDFLLIFGRRVGYLPL